MKKFVAIMASAVLSVSVCAFTACNPDGNKADNYTEVDLSTEEQRTELVNKLVEVIDPDKLFGDVQAKDFSLGLATDASSKLELTANAKEVMLPEATEALDLDASIHYDLTESAKFKYSAADGAMAESSTVLKAGVTASDELYGLLNFYLGLEDEQISEIKKAVANIDYTVKEYVDSEYIYLQYPEEILELIANFADVSLPEGGKIKIPLSDLDLDDDYIIEIGYSGAAASTLASALEGAPSNTDIMLKTYVTMAVEYFFKYEVKVETSNENGYAIRLSADFDTFMGILGDVLKDALKGVGEDAYELVEQFAHVTTLDVTVVFAVDENGAFKEFGFSVAADADYTLDLATLTPYDYLPTLNGTVKLSVDLSVKSYDGAISVPSSDNTYIDIFEWANEQ